MVKPDRVAIAYHHIVKIRPALQFIRNYRQAFIVPFFTAAIMLSLEAIIFA